jgi:hypothetical protein
VEGVIKLVMNGMTRGGKENPEGLKTKRVRELLASDPDGIIEASKLFGSAQPAIVEATEAVLRDGWNAGAAKRVENWALLAGARSPATALGRVWFNSVVKKQCPVLVSIRQLDRRVPDDREAWLLSVRRSRRHRVIE